MKIDRKAMREKLRKRTQESYERKDGGVSVKYFNAESDLPLWKCEVTKDEPHLIDIIPFKAGDNFPQIDRRNPIEKGEDVYVLDIFVHTNVGPGKEMVVCPTKNYAQPCPICEEIDRMINEDGAEWEDYKALDPKKRCAYNIICYDTDKQEKKGIQIWEVSHKYSEKILTALAKNSAARGGGVIAYADPSKDVGQTISFEVAGDTYRTISGHKLLPRDYDIPDSILEDTYSLDDHIVIVPYDEIKEKAFKTVKSEDDEDRPSKRKSRGRVEEDEDDNRSRRSKKKFDDEDDEDEKPSKKRSKARDEEDDEDEKPIKRRSKNIDEEDDDVDDKKVFKKKSRRNEEEEIDADEEELDNGNEDECPAGGDFGVDFDKYKDCDDCDYFDDCSDKNEEIKESKSKAKSKSGTRRR